MPLSWKKLRAAAPAQTRLFVRDRLSTVHKLVARLLLVFAVVALLTAVLWWDRGGLRDQIDGQISFVDVVYFTAVSVTTVGYGDIVPVSDRARLLDAAFVTPIRLFVWLLFVGTAYELLLQRSIERWRMNRMQKKLDRHAIVCGYGYSGRYAATELASRGYTVVVIDRDQQAVEAAANAGHIGLHGDATREADLLEAEIGKAAAVLISLGRDDAAVLTTLTARNLNATVRVVCNVSELENVKLISQAGADATVQPSQVGGYLLADAVRTEHITDYVTDLLNSLGGVAMQERVATAREIGLRMREVEPEMVLSLYRNGQPVGFWEGERSIIRDGDVLLVVQPLRDRATS